MAELPEGSRIIPNPINRVPGFSFEDHHFMPGFPEMSWPMLQWVLNTLYPDLRNLAPEAEQTIVITNSRESDLLDIMNTTLYRYPDIKLSSLPRLGDKPCLELSLRGKENDVKDAMAEIKSDLLQLKITFSEIKI